VARAPNMTDYKEEQANEIEALESIYPDELEIISEEDAEFHCFHIPVKAEAQENVPFGEEPMIVSCVLQFTYTATYPDEAPVMEIPSSENLEDEHTTALLEYLAQQAEENLGMVMVFTLYSVAQEWLMEKAEEMALQRQEEKERAAKELEELERKKFEGTRVTIETFLAWKDKFDAEMAEMKRQKAVQEPTSKKLTGKELFMSDNTLDDSDVRFLEEDGDTVQVDETLFQDMDDLDLDEDED